MSYEIVLILSSLGMKWTKRSIIKEYKLVSVIFIAQFHNQSSNVSNQSFNWSIFFLQCSGIQAALRYGGRFVQWKPIVNLSCNADLIFYENYCANQKCLNSLIAGFSRLPKIGQFFSLCLFSCYFRKAFLQTQSVN